jgi:hypothetical protein
MEEEDSRALAKTHGIETELPQYMLLKRWLQPGYATADMPM